MNEKLPPPKKYRYLLGSKWTSVQTLKGWRHFEVVEADFEVLPVKALMRAVCRQKINFWIEADELQDRLKWLPGWKRILEQT